MKRRIVVFVQKYLVNPLAGLWVRLGLARGIVLLETTGRKTGRPRRNPVGVDVDGATLWLVAEHGRRAAYIRNIEANPEVRVLMKRRWRPGVAHVLADDDAAARLKTMRNKSNARAVRMFGTDLLTARIDLTDSDE